MHFSNRFLLRNCMVLFACLLAAACSKPTTGCNVAFIGKPIDFSALPPELARMGARSPAPSWPNP